MCPQLGPLDYLDTDGSPIWNHGSARNWDGFDKEAAKPPIDKSLVVDISDLENPKVNEADFAEIPGYGIDQGDLKKNKKVIGNKKAAAADEEPSPSDEAKIELKGPDLDSDDPLDGKSFDK